MSTPLQFKFTIAKPPEGPILTVEEYERAILERLEKDSSSRKQSLRDLAVLYSGTGRKEEALDCLRKLAVLADGPEERARCYLVMGGEREQVRDFEGAVDFYSAAFELKPENTQVWYWINNNLGYSLVQLGRCQEAEPYLQRGIEIDPTRANAYKNLGLALLGQDRHKAAADYFVTATQTNASDPRSLRHLEELVAAHPEVLAEVPDMNEKIETCRAAVQLAAAAQPDIPALLKKLRKKQEKPWWAFWR